MALVVKNPPASAGDVRDVGLVPVLGRSPGKEMATHVWKIQWAVAPDGLQVHGVAKNLTRLRTDIMHHNWAVSLLTLLLGIFISRPPQADRTWTYMHVSLLCQVSRVKIV